MFDQKGNNGHESILSFLTQQRTGDLPDYSSYIREKRKIRTPVLKTPGLVMKKISSGSGYKAKGDTPEKTCERIDYFDDSAVI